MIAKESEIAGDALVSATVHVVGQSRAFKKLVESWVHEIGSLNDERAAALVWSMRMALTQFNREGTLSHMDRLASGLLQRLREESGE